MVFSLKAQIGYQVSLLNTATGEPRANENVEVTIEITDSEGTSICKETKNGTTNDFGVLSLQVGNSTTFENADWSKLPFLVSATVDGILVGKSQILNVPVAEAAKTLVGGISKSDIVGTWNGIIDVAGDEESFGKIYIKVDNTYSYEQNNVIYDDYYGPIPISYINQGYYKILGDFIYFISTNGCGVSFASYDNNKLIFGDLICQVNFRGDIGFDNLGHSYSRIMFTK